jgi:CIC family chloride channel protein
VHTPFRRLLLLTGLAVLLGLLSGAAAYVLVHLIALLTNVALFGRVAWELPSFAELPRSPRLVIVPVLGALAVALIARWAPIIKGHGIPEAMEAVLRKQSRVQPRTAVAKPLSAAIAIGTGGPFGAEGPIIVTGGSLGSLVGQLVPVSPSERKILLASGAAAGMAATFGAPLASVVLAIELLLFEFSTRAFIPLVVASAVAGGVHAAIFGAGPLFAVPQHDFAGLDKLPLFALLGLAAGLLAVVISKGLFVVEAGFRRLPVDDFWHPVIGAVGFGLVGLAVPTALGVGYETIDDVLAGALPVGALVAVMIAKLLAWWIALGSGTSGGTLAPVLLISGAAGALFGVAAGELFPGLELAPGAFALVAMAATFGAATRAAFTSIVFLFELTRDYEVILPLMLATVVADLVATKLLRDSLMTEKLSRRGLRVHGDYEADVLASTTVADAMTREVVTLGADATVGDAERRFATGAHSAYPLVDPAGRCVGIVSRGDLLHRLDEQPDSTSPVLQLASRDVVAVTPGDTLLEALRLMVEEQVDHLVVLDGHRLAGVVTRSDLLRVRGQRFALERPEQGWLAPMLRRMPGTVGAKDG